MYIYGLGDDMVNRMRTATVVVREKSVFGVLDYEDYQNILGIRFSII